MRKTLLSFCSLVAALSQQSVSAADQYAPIQPFLENWFFDFKA